MVHQVSTVRQNGPLLHLFHGRWYPALTRIIIIYCTECGTELTLTFLYCLGLIGPHLVFDDSENKTSLFP